MKKVLWIALLIGIFACGTVYAADAKITAMSADTTPTSDDLITTVDDVAGTAANKKVTLANLAANMPAITTATVNTGEGANELFDMDQNVLEASAVVFATVNTGQGANELYDMNQNVQTSSDVTFGELTSSAVNVSGAGEGVIGMENAGGTSYDLTTSGTALYLDGDIVTGGGGDWSDTANNETTGSLELGKELTTGGENTINFVDATTPAEFQVNGTKVADITETGMLIVGGDSTYINGIELSQVNNTTVSVSAGSLAIGDTILSVDASASCVVTAFSDGDYTYLYVDGDDVSVPSLVWSTTDPTEQSDGTWYNSNDRCVAAIYCDEEDEIAEFSACYIGNQVDYITSQRDQLQASGDPDATWTAPTTAASTKLPLNANRAFCEIQGGDSASNCQVQIANTIDVGGSLDTNKQVHIKGYNIANAIGWVNLLSDRNVVWAGADDDESSVALYIIGYGHRR